MRAADGVYSMSDESMIIASLLRAVDAAPMDVPLRLLLVNHLLDAGRNDEAISQLSVILGQEPNCVPALLAMQRALSTSPAPPSDDGYDWDRAARNLADSVPPERRGKALGAVMGAFSVAAVLGVP